MKPGDFCPPTPSPAEARECWPSVSEPTMFASARLYDVREISSFHGLIRDDQKVTGEILRLLKRIRIIPPLTNPGSGGLDRSI